MCSVCYVPLMRVRTKGMGEKGEVLDENGNIVRRRKTTIEIARSLRRPMTKAEQLLWDLLRKNTRGVKFYTQAPIDRFVVDFYCPREKLVIEVDGGVNAENFGANFFFSHTNCEHA